MSAHTLETITTLSQMIYLP